MATRSKSREEGGVGSPVTDQLKQDVDPELERATILGQIHFDLAVYHYMGRFEEDRAQDGVSSVFHLEKAAMCGLSTAEFTLGCHHLNIYHDELKELQLNNIKKTIHVSNISVYFQANEVSEKIGMTWMEKAAKHGNVTALLTVAQAYKE
eukprot:sb/3473542/